MSDWQPIETAPKDGSWFVIYTHGRYEVGRYNPLKADRFVPVDGEDGLFRKEAYDLYDWDFFNNFHAATHWKPLNPPEGVKP